MHISDCSCSFAHWEWEIRKAIRCGRLLVNANCLTFQSEQAQPKDLWNRHICEGPSHRDLGYRMDLGNTVAVQYAPVLLRNRSELGNQCSFSCASTGCGRNDFNSSSNLRCHWRSDVRWNGKCTYAQSIQQPMS